MADMGHVDADLVRAAGFELAADAGDVPALAAEALLDGIMGDGLAPVACRTACFSRLSRSRPSGASTVPRACCVAPQAKAV